MALEHPYTSTWRGIPDPDGVIVGPWRHPPAVGREGDRRDPVAVALECLYAGVPIRFYYKFVHYPARLFKFEKLTYYTLGQAKYEGRHIGLKRSVLNDPFMRQNELLCILDKAH